MYDDITGAMELYKSILKKEKLMSNLKYLNEMLL